MSHSRILVLMEASLIGLALGTRYPDFTEVPRARFIDRKGAYIGMFFTAISAGATISPVLVQDFLSPGFLGLAVATITGIVMATIICIIGYKAVISGIGLLYARETA